MAVSRRFGHPFLISLQRFGHPLVPSRDAQIPSVLVIPSKKNAGFRGKIENVLEMASAKYRNLFQYLKKKAYPEGFTKQKTTLRKFAKKFEYDSKLESLFYVAKEKDGTALRRLVINEEEKAIRVFKECHSAPFSGHVSHDNNLKKIKERFYLACVAGAKRGGRKAPLSTPATQARFYWPDYSKEKMEMFSYKFYLFVNAPSVIIVFKMPASIIENIR